MLAKCSWTSRVTAGPSHTPVLLSMASSGAEAEHGRLQQNPPLIMVLSVITTIASLPLLLGVSLRQDQIPQAKGCYGE